MEGVIIRDNGADLAVVAGEVRRLSSPSVSANLRVSPESRIITVLRNKLIETGGFEPTGSLSLANS